ncbi:MAG: DUF1840 domain-containing protein [Burkholderiales bacterium]
MLVEFDSKAGAITMFGDIAVRLLKMMGHSGTVPSALPADDIPAALARLQAALGGEAGVAARPGPEEEKEPPVSLRQRAHPLIDLLTRAAARGCDVTWR